jgi:hypothetical protein
VVKRGGGAVLLLRDAGQGGGVRGGRSVGITKKISFHKIKGQYLEIIVIFHRTIFQLEL